MKRSVATRRTRSDPQGSGPVIRQLHGAESESAAADPRAPLGHRAVQGDRRFSTEHGLKCNVDQDSPPTIHCISLGSLHSPSCAPDAFPVPLAPRWRRELGAPDVFGCVGTRPLIGRVFQRGASLCRALLRLIVPWTSTSEDHVCPVRHRDAGLAECPLAAPKARKEFPVAPKGAARTDLVAISGCWQAMNQVQ